MVEVGPSLAAVAMGRARTEAVPDRIAVADPNSLAAVDSSLAPPPIIARRHRSTPVAVEHP